MIADAGKISVIVPVYNMESRLRGCVDSIISQSYSELEIILVDDGSTDGSAQLCREYADADGRIVFLQKKNGGQGSARNMALDIATGDYVGFVDSDDRIEPDMYERLLAEMLSAGADISCCAFSKECHGTGAKRVLHQPDIMAAHLEGSFGLDQSPCDKLYKRELFEGIRFPGLRAYEDCATIYRVLARAEKTVSLDVGLYHYDTRENSTMTQPFSKVKYQAIEAYRGMYDFYEEEFPDYAPVVKRKLVGSVQYCVGETLARGMRAELTEELKNAVSTVCALSRADLPVKQRINIFLMERALPLYGLAYRIFK